MANKSFDDIIKNKLDSYLSDIDSKAWELFEEAQQANTLDNIIQDKVKNHQLEVLPMDWSDLETKLDKVPETNSFDELIGAKLGSLAISENSDWNDFEILLDKDANFDQEVAQKVKNHSVPNQNTQWPILSDHLDKIEQRRRRIVITKFIEAAVFILFIISIMQLFPIQNINKNKVFRTFAVTKDLNSVVPFIKNKLNNTNPNKSEQRIAELAEIVSISPFESLGSEISENRIKNTRSTLQAIQSKKQKTLATIPLLSNEIKTVSTIAYDNELTNSKASIASEDQNPPINTAEILSSIASLDVNELDYLRPKYEMPDDANLDIQKGQLWFNTFGSPNVNFISTPYDQYYGLNGYSSTSYGYTIGAGLSYETNNWEAGSGIAYSSLNFYPKPVKEIVGKANNGYSELTLKEIILNIVEVPVHFKYKFFSKKGWNLYANTGISAGVVSSAVYDINEEISAPLASRRPGSGVQSNNSVTHPILRNKEFNPGLFKRGKFAKNVFATLDTGVGIRKKMSDGISFYVQPTYHHNLAISGLGPNNDVHHRLSLEIGTKIRL